MRTEHRVVVYSARGQEDRDQMARSLDDWAAEGWEMVPLGTDDGYVVVVFRRTVAREG